ncbi:MAG: magnesium transporter [Verrucomicrobiota bacterium]
MTATTIAPGIGPATRFINEYVRLHPHEVAIAAESQSTEELLALLGQLPEHSLAQLFERLVPARAAAVLNAMEPELATRLLDTADPSRVSIALAQLDQTRIDTLIATASPGVAKELRESMSYGADTAGGMMDPKVASFRLSDTVDEALVRIRATKVKNIHDVYLIDEDGILAGWAPIQDLALAENGTPLSDILQPVRGQIQAIEPIDEVVDLLEKRKLSSIPVIDHEGKLIGVIRYSTLISAAQEDAMEDLQAMVGVSRDEKALSPAFFAVRKRLPWLQINLLTAFLAAAVVGIFEGTIAQVTALAVLLPVVAGQSGNTGAQALAVALRGLTVREIRIRQWPQLLRKEFFAGLLNGIAVAIVTCIGVYVWSQSIGLVFVIAISMVISMAIAGVAGAAVPIVLKALKQDPAQSSSIILTTVTDVFGFFSFLGIATLLMEMLPQG